MLGKQLHGLLLLENYLFNYSIAIFILISNWCLKDIGKSVATHGFHLGQAIFLSACDSAKVTILSGSFEIAEISNTVPDSLANPLTTGNKAGLSSGLTGSLLLLSPKQSYFISYSVFILL